MTKTRERLDAALLKKDDIVALYGQGLSMYDIASRLDLHPAAVHKVGVLTGCPNPRDGSRKLREYTATQAKREQIVAALTENMRSVRSIAEELCVRTGTVVRIAKEEGLGVRQVDKRELPHDASTYLEMYNAGDTVHKIARVKGVSTPYAFSVVERLVKKEAYTGRKSVISRQSALRRLEMYNSGMTTREIAVIEGITPQAVSASLLKLDEYKPRHQVVNTIVKCRVCQKDFDYEEAKKIPNHWMYKSYCSLECVAMRDPNVSRGSDRSNSVLTEEMVTAIRIRRRNGESAIDLAKEYGIKLSSLCHASTGRTWAHIPEPTYRKRKHNSKRYSRDGDK